MEAKEYLVDVYAFLVKQGKRNVESVPELYRMPVSELLAQLNEHTIERV